MTIRVLIAEDEEPLREALVALVRRERDFELAGAVGDAEAAVELAAMALPDVAIVDVRMPGGGREAVQGIRTRSPGTNVIVLSAFDDRATVFEMLAAGAIGYLVKGTSPLEIGEAIERAARGQASLSATMISSVFEELAADIAEQAKAEEILRRSEQKFRGLLEASPDAVVIVDDRGEIALVNSQTELMFGYRREELIGLPVEMLLAERQRAQHVDHRAAYLSDPRTRPMGAGLALAGRRRDGDEFPVDISLSSFETSEGRLFTACIRDTAERNATDETPSSPIAAEFVEQDERIELEHALDERRALLAHIVAAGEEERRRIADDIHDDSIQAITASAIYLQLLRRALDDPEQLQLLTDLEQSIQLSISRLRHLLFELRPPTLDNEGLVPALLMYLDQTYDESKARFTLDDRFSSQPAGDTRVVLYRIVQEAVTNVRKHAQARTATITLEDRDGGYLARIQDDGVGFAVDASEPTALHLGLASMKGRAALAGGWLRVTSTPGTGTTIDVWIPRLPEAAS